MNELGTDTAYIDRADHLVGRFIRLFGAIELELNDAVRKLFELSPDSADILCAGIDFFKKLQIVTSALRAQDAEANNKDDIDKLFSRIARINDKRTIAAHATFGSNDGDGVFFRRITTSGGELKRSNPTWTENECASMAVEMESIRQELHRLAQAIAPYRPSLDSSDPRNSGYLAIL